MLDLGPADDCATCGFDAARWNDTDTIRTLHHAGGLLTLWSAPTPGAVPTAPSVLDHVAAVATAQRTLIELIDAALAHPGADAGPGVRPPPSPSTVDPVGIESDGALAAAGTTGDTLRDRLAALDAGRWDDGVVIDGQDRTVRWASRQAVHHLWHRLGDIALVVAGSGHRTGVLHGSVEVVNSSDGGVPKTPVEGAEVGPTGLIGDRQATRIHHGRPWQALCLYSAEVIDALRTEGHPVAAGTTGENLTLSGLDWAELRAGDVMEIGTVICQLSAPAQPCATIAASFTDREFRRIDHDLHPGWSRWYASVLRPGRITAGDAVTVRAPVPADRARTD